MKILVFGRGVIGAQYGWALEKAGHQVDFYVRPGRAATYGTFINMKVFDMRKSFNGVQLNEIWPVRFLEELDVDHDYDLILLSVQHYRFSEAAAFLSSRVGKASILIFNNFWADPELAAAPLPREQLVWGFPGAGGGFSAGHTLQGGFFGQVQFGSFNPTLTAREKAVRDLMRGAGFKVVEQPDFRGWLWTHFALNAGIHAQALQAGSMARMVKVMAQARCAERAGGVAHSGSARCPSEGFLEGCNAVPAPDLGRGRRFEVVLHASPSYESHYRQRLQSRGAEILLPRCAGGGAPPWDQCSPVGSGETVFRDH